LKIKLISFLIFWALLTVCKAQTDPYIKILDSAQNMDDKGRAIQLLNETLLTLPESFSLIQGKYYLGLGQIYGNQHKLNLGYKYYNRALQIGLKADHNLLKGKGYLGKGGILLIKELHHPESANYDSVIYFFSKSLPFLKFENDSSNIEGLYSNLALILTNTDITDSAKSSMEMILQRRLKREDKIGVIISLNNLGLLFRRQKAYKKSEEYYSESFKMAASDTLLLHMANASLGLAKMFQEAGIDKKGLAYYIQYDSINKLFLNKEFENKIAESETKLLTAEKEKIISKKRQENLILIIVLVATTIISILGYLFILQKRRITKATFDKTINNLLQDQEMKTAYALLDGQDQERKRIASELHDNLGSILVTINMYADALSGNINKEKASDLAKRISSTSNLANEEVRKISHSLDSGLLKHFGLKTAINQLMEAIQLSKKIEIVLSLDIEDQFSNEAGIEAYRIIQELVNNSMKHAKCTRINLEVNQIEKEVSIIYEDNGIGFDQDKIVKGMGLNNIEKRAEKLGGDIKIDTGKNGSSFIIELPIK